MRTAALFAFAVLSATAGAEPRDLPPDKPGRLPPKTDGGSGDPAKPDSAKPDAAKPDPAEKADDPLARWVGVFDGEVEAGGKSYKMTFTGDWQAGKKFVRLRCVRDDKRESFAVYGWDGTTFRSWHYDDEGGVATVSGTWNERRKELTQRHDGGPDVVTTGVWLSDDSFVWTMTKYTGEDKVVVQQGKLLRRKK